MAPAAFFFLVSDADADYGRFSFIRRASDIVDAKSFSVEIRAVCYFFCRLR